MHHAEQGALDYTVGRDDETAFRSNKSCEFDDRSAGSHFGRMFGGNELRALLGLQGGAPTADQEAKAAAAETALKQEGTVLDPTGHYGSPYGAGPQYGPGGGDQYGYGPVTATLGRRRSYRMIPCSNKNNRG
jgi:hypothetical protein